MGIIDRDQRLLELLAEAIRICTRPDHQTLLRVVEEETAEEVEQYSRPLKLIAGGRL